MEGEKKGSARGSVQGGFDYATTLNIEVDPQRRCFGRRESDFALERLVECRVLESERVRLVSLRWHSSGSEVRLGLLVCLKKKKTQKFAVHAGGGTNDRGEKRNVLIVGVLLLIGSNLSLRSNTQRRVQILRVRQAPVLLHVAGRPKPVMGDAEVKD